MIRLTMPSAERGLSPQGSPVRRLADRLTPAHVWWLWALTRAVMLANLVIGHHYGDPQFYQYAGDFAVGKLPYLNIPVEYPPLALLFILLPAIPLLPFAGIAPRPDANPHPLHPDPLRYGAYGVSFGVEMLALDVLTLVLVQRVGRRWTPGDPRGLWSGLLYVVLVALSGALLQKFDLVPGTLCLLAVLLLLERRDGWAWAVLALATLTKGYPILLAPLFVLWRVGGGQPDWAALRRAVVGGAVASAAVLLPVLLTAGLTPLVQSVLYHADRGTEIESVLAAVVLAVGWLPGLHVTTWYNPADLSRDVISPLVGPLGDWTIVVLLAACALVYALVWRRLRSRGPMRAELREQTGNPAPALVLMQATTAVILIFALCFRAMPAHYLLGVLPLAAVLRLPGAAQWRWLGLLVAGLLASQFVVTIWHSIVALQPAPVGLLIVRAALLVAAGVVLIATPLGPPRLAAEQQSE